MIPIVQSSVNARSPLGVLGGDYCRCKKRLISCFSLSRPKLTPLYRSSRCNFLFRPLGDPKWPILEVGRGKDVILVGEEMKRRKRVVLVRFNNQGGFGFNGGGGGKDDGVTARVVGNLVLAIGLTYLSMTGQLGWLLAVIIPIVGLGAFLWWAGRDIVQSACPNCGNDFQIFKSTLKDELQLCPFCSQPFSVVDDKFVKESVKFSNEFTAKQRAANDFSPRPKRGKDSSRAVVDVEAEVKDVD
ncbi:hypothetical protein CRG98_028450 [Punica granatum]|uniref:Uncharacterized protein n=1 Tax=Punica granatum TaxID=22663 RepID=A0A2I0J548_PUNGR|nr:hypothetical protein CRG98_028450 [Punica granatum]